MLQNALYQYYEQNLKDIIPMGAEFQKIDYIIVLDKSGKFITIEKGDEEEILVPIGKHRTSGVWAKIFYDKIDYVLGWNKSEYLYAFIEKCKSIADDVDDNDLKSVCSFYENGEYEKAKDFVKCNFIEDKKLESNFFSFRIDEKPKIIAHKKCLFDYAMKSEFEESDKKAICCITGNECNPIINTLEDIPMKSLTSFNKDTFMSFGYQGGENAPISKEANFKCNAAFKYLYYNKKNTYFLGGIKYLFFVLNDSDTSKDAFIYDIFDEIFKTTSLEDMEAHWKSIFSGIEYNVNNYDTVYFCGLDTSQKGRIPIVYENVTTVSEIARNIKKYFENTPHGQRFGIYQIIDKADIKIEDRPRLITDLIRAIFEGGKYPEFFVEKYIHNVTFPKCENGKIKAPLYYSEVTHNFACDTAINYLKNFLIRNKNFTTNDFNMETSNNQFYLLGRFFASNVKIQSLNLSKNYFETPLFKTFWKKYMEKPYDIFSKVELYANSYIDDNTKWAVNRRDAVKEELLAFEPLTKRTTNSERSLMLLGFTDQWSSYFKKAENNAE